uniref:Vitamin K-dependent protein C n=1 Tax=Anas platyrhynchos TaxID=8839 RepID=A0A8B9R285_ANAPL
DFQITATHRVEKIIPYDEFDSKSFDGDIALIKLKEPITFSEDVIPACLPEEDFANDVLMNQTFGIISGFGNSFERAEPVRRMKVLQVPYVNKRTCRRALTNLVTSNMFCAGYSKDGQDACQGDGGGPHVTEYNGTYFATGIISWGEGCGKKGKYGIYTKLSSFLPWLALAAPSPHCCPSVLLPSPTLPLALALGSPNLFITNSERHRNSSAGLQSLSLAQRVFRGIGHMSVSPPHLLFSASTSETPASSCSDVQYQMRTNSVCRDRLTPAA